MVEQVFFTWANDGLSGRGMLQPVAVSRGFRGLSDGDHRRAMRLCSYDAGAAAANGYPPSFGWIDSGDTRFAFQREYLPSPSMQRGRPGNFAAHIMVGPSALLPTAKLLASFGTASWWKGPTSLDDLALPTSLEWSGLETSPQGPTNRAITAGILSALLKGQVKLRFESQTDETAAALRQVINVMPDLLDGLSLSTFEGPILRDWFDIVGHIKNPGSSILAEADYLLSNPKMAPMLPAVHPKADPRRTNDLAAARSLIQVHRQVASGNADAETVAQILAFPGQVSLAMTEFVGFREALATAIVAKSPPVVRAIRSHGHEMSNDVLREIGGEVGRAISAVQADGVYRSLSGVPDALFGAYTDVLIRRADIVPLVDGYSTSTLRHFFEARGYRAAAVELRRALESRLARCGMPADLFCPHLSDEGWSELFVSLAGRRRGSWNLPPTELGLFLARAATAVPEGLETFFRNAQGEELATRVRALLVAPGVRPFSVRLTGETMRSVLLAVDGDVEVAQLVTILDVSGMAHGADRAVFEKLVRRVLERYDSDGSFTLADEFWIALESHGELRRLAEAHGDRVRTSREDAAAVSSWVAQMVAFLEFENSLLRATAGRLDVSWSRRELRWLAVVSLRAALTGAGDQWIMESLAILVDEVSPGQRVASWLVGDLASGSGRKAFVQLVRYLAIARPSVYGLLEPRLDAEVLATVRRDRGNSPRT